jgi:hypothetical protein
MKLKVERQLEKGEWVVKIVSYDDHGDRLTYSDTVKNFDSRAARKKVISELVADNGCTYEDADKAVTAAFNQLTEDGDAEDQGRDHQRRDQASQLIDVADVAELWHGVDMTAYASVTTDSCREDWELQSKGFSDWLISKFYERYNKPPTNSAKETAMALLSSKARRDGDEYPVYIRVAEEDGRIYLDLANAARQVVEIDAYGWRVFDISPVRFKRSESMKPLPEPRKGNLNTLRDFLNFGPGDDAVWALYAACLVQALRGDSHYPPLVIYGEHGSAKTTAAKMYRRLIDPNKSDLRSPPKNETDLFIQAMNGQVLGYDNLSGLSPWLSDALCRISTGGGMSARKLYTDNGEVIFEGTRPVVLNGIEEIATRSDLMDRAVILTLPAIPPEKRRLESELWRAFDTAHPYILGGLLDAVSLGLRNLSQVRLDKAPRMADFAQWALACEPAFGVPEGTFLAAYNANRDNANQTAVETSVIGPYVLMLNQQDSDWQGTMTELLAKLSELAPEEVTKQKNWPKRPNDLSGKLIRITPNLRAEGINIEVGKIDRNRRYVRIYTQSSENLVSVVSPVSPSLVKN